MSSISRDPLIIICRFLAEEPKDLARFGRVCKKTHAIVSSEIFKKLLDLCQKRPSILKERLKELKGTYDYGDGLISKAARRLYLVSKDVEADFSDYKKAAAERDALQKEYANLVKSKGPVNPIDQEIAAEIKKIQEKI